MIATGSNEVRQVFVGDGQVHGEITYEYLIEPEVNRQLENVAIPYKNNPAYIDRITVTRRTIQNGNIIAIDYKDVDSEIPNQDEENNTYCVWFASDKMDDADENYKIKIAILHRKGYQEMIDKLVDIPFANPFEDTNVPIITAKIKQLSQRCASVINQTLFYYKNDLTIAQQNIGKTNNVDGTISDVYEYPIDLCVYEETCYVITLRKNINPDANGNYKTEFGVQLFYLKYNEIIWSGKSYIVSNSANNDYMDGYENKIIYDPFHEFVYLFYSRTNSIWKLSVSDNDTGGFKINTNCSHFTYLTCYSSVAIVEKDENNTTNIKFYKDKEVFTKTINKSISAYEYNRLRTTTNFIYIGFGYVHYKEFNIIYGINTHYGYGQNYAADFTFVNDNANNDKFGDIFIGKILHEDTRNTIDSAIRYSTEDFGVITHNVFRNQFINNNPRIENYHYTDNCKIFKYDSDDDTYGTLLQTIPLTYADKFNAFKQNFLIVAG